jgi:hypothetical protein
MLVYDNSLSLLPLIGLEATFRVYCLGALKLSVRGVPDDPKLLDDGGEILESQGRRWRFDSRL